MRHVILGGTGHVGSAVADTLLAAGETVIVVTSHSAKFPAIRARGAEPALADVHDVESLRAVFKRGDRAFLLNPPADPSTDTDAEERRTCAAIVQALEDSGLQEVVAESTYGAQPGAHAGDLSVLFEMEEALRAQSIPADFNRGAYYMSNWDSALDTARADGVVHTMFPVDLKIPMVAPRDLGQAAAKLLLEPYVRPRIQWVEGPERYSASDVAAAFSKALGKPVRAVSTPPEKWVEAFKSLGFSDAAADSYARMTQLTVDGEFPPVSEVKRGETSLQRYITDLCEQAN